MKVRAERTAYPNWLVDVSERCVVPFGPATTRYLTLSYTWGQVQGLRTTTKNIGSLKRSGSLHPGQSPGIPQTVYDAMKVTQFLGERYLWVDSLCIIQDDQAALYRDLNAMHLIYANSILCLVALAGTDGNHGLRGVEGVSAAPRAVEQVTDWLAAPSPTPSPGQLRPINCRWHEFKSLAKSNECQVPQGWRGFSKDWKSSRYQMV